MTKQVNATLKRRFIRQTESALEIVESELNVSKSICDESCSNFTSAELAWFRYSLPTESGK